MEPQIIYSIQQDLMTFSSRDLRTMAKYYSLAHLTNNTNDLAWLIAIQLLKRRAHMPSEMKEREAKLRELLAEKVKDIEFFQPEGVSGGIYIYTTISGQKYIVKPEVNSIDALRANYIAHILKINVPALLLVNKEDIPNTEIITLETEKFEGINPDEVGYIVLEYIPDAKILPKAHIPPEYCKEAYIQAGRIMVFDILVWNYDRFYFIDYKECNNDVNDGNLLYSSLDNKVYAIDHSVNERNAHYRQQEIFDDLFSDGPLAETTKDVITCALKSMGRDKDCPDSDLILQSAKDTIELIKQKYEEIKCIWPSVPQI